MESVIDGARSLIDAHKDRLCYLAVQATVGMSEEEIAQAIEDGRREMKENLRAWGIEIDF